MLALRSLFLIKAVLDDVHAETCIITRVRLVDRVTLAFDIVTGLGLQCGLSLGHPRSDAWPILVFACYKFVICDPWKTDLGALSVLSTNGDHRHVLLRYLFSHQTEVAHVVEPRVRVEQS